MYEATQIIVIFVAVCSINTVSGSNICSYLPWSTNNNQKCTDGGIERDTLFILSFFPLGIGKFYSGDHFNGLFELIECSITLTSILVWYCCKRQNVKFISDVLLALALVSCYVLEIAHMICSEQVEPFYIITIVISLILPCIQCCCSCCNNHIIIMTVSTMLLLIATDAIMVRFFKENDGHGCPLID